MADLQSFLRAKQGINTYNDLLVTVQNYMSNTYENLLSSEMNEADSKLVKDYIRQYIDMARHSRVC